MPAPYFVQANGIPYIGWQPTPAEVFLVPAQGYTVQQITVGPSPFSYTCPKIPGGQQVLIGGGQITSISTYGTYPPSAPAGFVTPPSGNFLITYQDNNDCTYILQGGQTMILAYTAIPQMYVVNNGGPTPPFTGFIFGESGFGTGGF